MNLRLPRYVPFFFMIIVVATLGYLSSTSMLFAALSTEESRFEAQFYNAYKYDPPVSLASETFFDLDDKEVALKNLRGQWLIINFWATWCPGCVIELPSLRRLAEKEKNIKIIYVSLDFPNSAADLMTRMNAAKVPEGLGSYYTNNIDIWDEMGIPAMPTTFILDPDGRLYYKLVGEINWMSQETLAFIDDLVNN